MFHLGWSTYFGTPFGFTTDIYKEYQQTVCVVSDWKPHIKSPMPGDPWNQIFPGIYCRSGIAEARKDKTAKIGKSIINCNIIFAHFHSILATENSVIFVVNYLAVT